MSIFINKQIKCRQRANILIFLKQRLLFIKNKIIYRKYLIQNYIIIFLNKFSQNENIQLKIKIIIILYNIILNSINLFLHQCFYDFFLIKYLFFYFLQNLEFKQKSQNSFFIFQSIKKINNNNKNVKINIKTQNNKSYLQISFQLGNRILRKKTLASPIDQMLKNYLKQNKSIGSSDRKLVADNIYKMVRNKTYLDTITFKPISWEKRLETMYTERFKTMQENTSLLPQKLQYSLKFIILYQDIVNSHGEKKAFEICKSQMFKAPLTIRVNPLKIERDQLLQKWQETHKLGVRATSHSPYGIKFTTTKSENLFEMIEYNQGYFEIQDEASQLVALEVKCSPGQKILDYCAGSGGKSLAFAHLMEGKGQLYLHDIRNQVLIEAKKRFKKAGIQNVQFHNQESLNEKKQLLKNKFDWILCDVPCTGTGTLRRNPDLKYKYNKDRLKYFVDLQKGIFKEAIEYLNLDNGKIAYSTCSILNEENQFQIEHFCEQFNLKVVEKPFQSLTDQNSSMDGFFCAVLESKNKK
ncbi:sun family protein, putative [Ichthyophthirius multifiliis]|uniref:Sun family protein, putative n=1 Tax=Ichthyophthirius multifiliis TaxID=5932 RepID=G0QKB5_ICHMU|nr:sun family protein, putative [Ichthyophthirius multifiliis]EGR34345.1 sun family protein, putative [Ichthyophthirius multifiliis]|eukprot:XP_004039649.1 sun family protein, putative [Ichthyophthirius multifiliis]